MAVLRRRARVVSAEQVAGSQEWSDRSRSVTQAWLLVTGADVQPQGHGSMLERVAQGQAQLRKLRARMRHYAL